MKVRGNEGNSVHYGDAKLHNDIKSPLYTVVNDVVSPSWPLLDNASDGSSSRICYSTTERIQRDRLINNSNIDDSVSERVCESGESCDRESVGREVIPSSKNESESSRHRRVLRSNSKIRPLPTPDSNTSSAILDTINDTNPIIINPTLSPTPLNSRSLRKRSLSPSTSNTSAQSKSGQGRIVRFDKNIPLPAEECPTGQVSDYQYLVGKIHRDDKDELLYKVTKVYRQRGTGFIVADRVLLLKNGLEHTIPDNLPTHVRDLVILTNRFEASRSHILRCNLAHLTSDGYEYSSEEELSLDSNSSNSNLWCNQTSLHDTNSQSNIDTHMSELTDNMFELLLGQYDHGDPLVEYCLETCTSQVDIFTPLTRKQALKSPQFEQWHMAEQKEIDSIQSKGVFQPAQLPRGKKLLRTKWVYKIKHGSKGEIKSYKVRLVACGYAQIFGVDFDETYSPVARMTSLRILFAISAQLGLRIHQMDVDTAFLNAPVTEDIYIRPPEGFPIPSNMNCFKLKKALYGLKQSPREWYNHINGFLHKINFKRLDAEPCLYFREDDDDNTICIISLYVDDLVIAGSSRAIIDRVKRQLSENYEMKDLGVVNHILGCEARHNEETGTTYLSQYQFTKSACDKFFPNDLSPCETPFDSTVVLSKSMSPQSPAEKGEMSNIPYREAVGTLLWLSLGTRPDICYAVSQVAKYNDCYGREHWKAVKRIFRYLKGTLRLGLKFMKSNHNGVRSIREIDICLTLGFVDSDHGRCIDTRRSITGYIFFLGSSPISWQSKQQTSVALSSMEAEYMAACAAAQEIIWLNRLLQEFGCHFTQPITLLEDNQSCIHLSKNPGDFVKSKHIHTRYHFVREQVEKGTIILKKIDTKDNLADIFTKPLTNRVFNNIASQFMSITA